MGTFDVQKNRLPTACGLVWNLQVTKSRHKTELHKNEVALQVTNSEIFIEIFLSIYQLNFIKYELNFEIKLLFFCF